MPLMNPNPVFNRVEKESNQSVAVDNIEVSSVATAKFSSILLKTLVLFLVAIGSGVGFVYLVLTQGEAFLGTAIILVIAAPFLAVIFILIGMISTKLAPVFSVLYSALQGVTLGVLCAIVEIVFPGIAITALVSVVGIFVVMLALYSIKAIRATAKFYRFMAIAGVSALVILLTSWIMSMFGLMIPIGSDMFFIVILFDIFLIVFGALMFIMDFDRAKQLADNGAPKKYEWQVSLGMMVTIVWLFTRILILLIRIAALAGRR